MFDRRQDKTTNSRSQKDHPERIFPNLLSTVVTCEVLPTKTITTEKTSVPVSPTAATTKEEVETIISSAETTAASNRCSDFYLACRANNIEEVKKLLQTITLDEIDRMEPNGSTALHTACYHGHREIVKLLLEAGADRSIENKYKYLPFDEAADDRIKDLFLRVPNNNRLVSRTGAIEWVLINNDDDNDDVLENALQERQHIQSIYDNTSGVTPLPKMFEKIEKNYINKTLSNFDGIDHIKRFFRKATEEENPCWIIKAYTAETDFYRVLNKEIAGGASHAQNERKYIIALLWHHPTLDELSFTGVTYRVMKINMDDLEKYQVNGILMTKSFLSTAIDEKIAAWFLCQQELSFEQDNGRQRCKIDGQLIKSWVMCKYKIKHRRTALHIEHLSQYINEGEILIMPYTVFKIYQVEKIKPSYLLDGQSITEIYLEESDQFLKRDE